jgi:hypothetical protein
MLTARTVWVRFMLKPFSALMAMGQGFETPYFYIHLSAVWTGQVIWIRIGQR